MHISKTTKSVFSFLLLARTAWTAPTDKRATDKCLNSRWFSIDPSSTVRKAWPKKTVEYCFKDANAKTKLADYVTGAFKIWTDNGLKDVIRMKEVECKDNKKALIISVNSDKKINSQPGYRDAGDEQNYMNVDPDSRFTNGATRVAVAHELGHVFGLLHEHQRTDAPDSVVFNCKNLRDYDTFANEKDKDGKKKYDMKTLCSDQEEATKAGFSALDLIPYSSDFAGGCKKSDTFDFSSIMLYGSKFGGKNNKNVLLRKNKKDGDSQVPTNSKPSNGDISRLKDMYPETITWYSNKKCEDDEGAGEAHFELRASDQCVTPEVMTKGRQSFQTTLRKSASGHPVIPAGCELKYFAAPKCEGTGVILNDFIVDTCNVVHDSQGAEMTVKSFLYDCQAVLASTLGSTSTTSCQVPAGCTNAAAPNGCAVACG